MTTPMAQLTVAKMGGSGKEAEIKRVIREHVRPRPVTTFTIEQDGPDETDTPKDTEECCQVPNDDKWMIQSQILSTFTTFLLWVWRVNLLISVVGLVMFQIPWCYRQMKVAMHGLVIVTGVCSLMSLCVWMVFTVAWFSNNNRYYTPFSILKEEEQHNLMDWQLVWGSFAYVCGTLWASSAYGLFYFVKGGWHAEWEEIHSKPRKRNKPKRRSRNSRILMQECAPLSLPL